MSLRRRLSVAGAVGARAATLVVSNLTPCKLFIMSCTTEEATGGASEVLADPSLEEWTFLDERDVEEQVSCDGHRSM